MIRYLIILLICGACQATDPVKEELDELLAGNRRFVSGQPIHKNLSAEALQDLKEGQSPIAVIVGCADSRVPPEVIFDQGLGMLFVVRVAGNVIGPIELDSVRFAVKKLKTPLIMVLGHEGCAAVQDAMTSGQAADSLLPHIYPLIAPALKRCEIKGEDSLKHAICCNVLEGVKDLQEDIEFKKLIDLKELKVVGGYYDFDEGTVDLLNN